MYEKKTLPNGVRILTEHVPGVRSVSLGIWVGTGSRHESAGENGAAHFIEHMLFKGTRSRTAAQLAEEMDAVGGQINAFTTKECTCFYARVLDTHLARAADILCDMFFHSRFDDADVETERGVILEEIGMYEDNPEDLCAERLAGAVFKGSPLARPILGRKATLDKMDGAWLRAYQRAHYRPDRIVVALAGAAPHRCEGRRLCARGGGEEEGHRAEPPDPGFPRPVLRRPPAVPAPAPVLHPGGRHVLPPVPAGAGAEGALLLHLLLRHLP